MRVLVNGLAATGAKTGIGHYTTELVRELRESSPLRIELYESALARGARTWLAGWRHDKSRSMGKSGGVGDSRSGGRFLDLARQVSQFAYDWRFRQVARRSAYDLYHEPNFLPVPCDLPTVVTVHDLSVLLYPEWHPADRVAQHEREFHRGLARSQHVLTVSETVRQEIIQYLGLPADRVTRTYNGIRPGLRPLPATQIEAGRRALGLPENYLLHVGTLEPRKNVLMLLRAYGGLSRTIREKFPLILVGGRGWNSGEVFDYLNREGQRHGVRYLGYVADDQFPVLYNAARALLFPSHYEGFGLPPVEMLACGGAVLGSAIGALQETVGRKAHLIDPSDEEGWRDALEKVCTDQEWWLELRRDAVDVVRPFTWRQCARDTLAVYESIVGSRAQRQAA